MTGKPGYRRIISNSLLGSLLLGLLLPASVCSNPIHHLDYASLTDVDNTTVIALFQALTDDINISLSHAIEEDFVAAQGGIAVYREFVNELSAFRSEMGSRDLDAVILRDTFSTGPLASLGQGVEDVISGQAEVLESIQLLSDETEEGEFWLEALKAEHRIDRFDSVIDIYSSTLGTLPAYIDPTQLEYRATDLRQVCEGYADRLSDIEAGEVTSIQINASVDRGSVLLGGDFSVSGTFYSGDRPMPGFEVLVVNGSTVLQRNVTRVDGSFVASIHIPTSSPAGPMKVRAVARFEGAEVRSEGLSVEVLKIPTEICLSAPRDVIPPGQDIDIWGSLVDPVGRSVPGVPISVHSSSGESWERRTDQGGAFSLRYAPIAEGSFSMRASFAGNRMYSDSTSPWLNMSVVDGSEPAGNETRLTLASNATMFTPGETVEFRGQLTTEGGAPISHRQIEVDFLGNRTSISADSDGRYRTTVSIPDSTTPGFYAAHAIFLPRDSGLSWARSTTLVIRVESNLNRDGRLPTEIELSVTPTLLSAGESLYFNGRLTTLAGQPIPNTQVRLAFLARARTALTGDDGSFNLNWQTGANLSTGTYPARATFTSEIELDLSSSNSNRVFVTVIGGDEVRTNLNIRSSSLRVEPGGTAYITGRLYDDWGRGVPDGDLTIRSPNLTAELTVSTLSEGRYSLAIAMPEGEGRFFVSSHYDGGPRHLPCSSRSVVIDVREAPKGPWNTTIILNVPDTVSAGASMPLIGMLLAEGDLPLPSRNVTILWEGLPAWSSTTDQDGAFRIEAQIDAEATGTHAVEAVYTSSDRDFLSSRSSTHLVQVQPRGQDTNKAAVAVVALSLLAVGLAIARSIIPRARISGIGSSGEQAEARDGDRATPVSGREIEAGIPGPTASEKGDERPQEDPIESFAALVKLISRSLNLDLRGKTHTEIVELLVSEGVSSEAEDATIVVSRIYEKAAFSGREVDESELDSFRRSIEALQTELNGGEE